MLATQVWAEPATLTSQTAAAALPSNAHASGYSGGWECARGFRRLGEACAAVKVPSNAYLGPSGNEWACNRGYAKAAQGCTLVKVPADAHPDDSTFGSGWRCDRGPQHAYLDYSGNEWRCEDRYRREGGACAIR